MSKISSPILATLAMALTVGPASAAKIEVLHRFVTVSKGARPRADLISDASGVLYGTTYTGSNDGNGTVFELLPPTGNSKHWTEQVLHHFGKNTKHGIFPQSALALDSAGNLYGTTSEGGTKTDGGVAFELIRPTGGTGEWEEKILHKFTTGQDGGTPDGSLVFGADGSLYGTAGYGGYGGAGVVYKLTQTQSGDWTQTILYSFANDANGGYPYCTLTFDPAGNIYGVTANGGNAGNGVVFELSPPTNGGFWTETTLHSFDAETDGLYPRAGVIRDSSGNLYGTTEAGGSIGYGTVFEVSPPAKGGTTWTETILHNFGFSPDGGTPGYSTLLMDSLQNLYGTTQTGGTAKNGVVFKISPPAKKNGDWTETVLHTFTGSPDGSQPESGLLMQADGSMIGTTLFGGTGNNYGLIFKITP
jgi:uncharacterized repeat protein (TIGR03803 family)